MTINKTLEQMAEENRGRIEQMDKEALRAAFNYHFWCGAAIGAAIGFVVGIGLGLLITWGCS